MVKTAVIMAAGLGSRLKEKTAHKPKGFLEVEGISLIERSVQNLLSQGIQKIFIGTGYLSEVYDDFAKNYPQIQTIKSERYATTSSMFTLFNMRNFIHDDFILLESDLLYERGAIYTLLQDSRPDIILASGATQSGDEVYIETDDAMNLVQMSKRHGELKKITGELVGISKISLKRYRQMCVLFENQTNEKIDYEYIMVEASKANFFQVKKIDDLLWCEIDDEHHLSRALSQILPKIKAKTMQIKRNILLNPGPATTTDTVKLAQVVPDICPRESEFGEVMSFIAKGLTEIVADVNLFTAVLFGGSGTAAVEAILTSVVPHDKKVLIVNNGAYGKRMCQIAQRYKINFIEFKSPSITPIDLNSLEKIIESDLDISHISLVHNETTTGLLNDLTSIGALAQKYNLQFIVDAMSSYAALPIDMQKQHITFLAASSNKNIQGMAGVSFAIGENAALNALQKIEPRTFYLSLYEQYVNFQNTQQMRFTPPVQTLYALKQALIEAKEETTENRYARYAASWQVLTDALKKMGLTYLVSDEHHSKIITSIDMPKGVDFNKMHDYFYSKGYTIYPGKVEEFNTFRVANIGQIDSSDMQNFVQLLTEYLDNVGKS